MQRAEGLSRTKQSSLRQTGLETTLRSPKQHTSGCGTITQNPDRSCAARTVQNTAGRVAGIDNRVWPSCHFHPQSASCTNKQYYFRLNEGRACDHYRMSKRVMGLLIRKGVPRLMRELLTHCATAHPHAELHSTNHPRGPFCPPAYWLGVTGENRRAWGSRCASQFRQLAAVSFSPAHCRFGGLRGESLLDRVDQNRP